MEFEMIITKTYAMRKLLLIISVIAFLAPVADASEPVSSDRSKRAERKLAKQEKIKEAVESKSYAIELDRLFMSRYGSVNLNPRMNYIIINGNKATISAGYMGRQCGLTPVAGIRLTGRPSVYKMQKNESKGNYRIVMEVAGGNDNFHITLTISENGNCSALISGIRIDDSRYSGTLVPLGKKQKVPEPDDIRL
jgi:hypothetical protein